MISSGVGGRVDFLSDVGEITRSDTIHTYEVMATNHYASKRSPVCSLSSSAASRSVNEE